MQLLVQVSSEIIVGCAVAPRSVMTNKTSRQSCATNKILMYLLLNTFASAVGSSVPMWCFPKTLVFQRCYFVPASAHLQVALTEQDLKLIISGKATLRILESSQATSPLDCEWLADLRLVHSRRCSNSRGVSVTMHNAPQLSVSALGDTRSEFTLVESSVLEMVPGCELHFLFLASIAVT